MTNEMIANQILILENPKAGASSGRTKIKQLASRLSKQGCAVEILTNIDSLSEKVTIATQAGTLQAVVSAGGDGTVSLVANRTPPGTPIAILPLGTENLLSKHLGLSTSPSELCRIIRQGHTVQLDVGLANKRIFLLMVGCGFDAEVVRRLHESRTGHIHHLSYTKPIFDSIRSYQYPEIRVYCDLDDGFPAERVGKSSPIVARWAFIGNLPTYAAGLRIVPAADGTDGLLDLCTFKKGSFWKGLIYLGGVFLRQHHKWDDCEIRRTKHIRIESDQPVPFQLDGDPGGYLPLEIEILPKRLTLLVNESFTHDRSSQPVPTQ